MSLVTVNGIMDHYKTGTNKSYHDPLPPKNKKSAPVGHLIETDSEKDSDLEKNIRKKGNSTR